MCSLVGQQDETKKAAGNVIFTKCSFFLVFLITDKAAYEDAYEVQAQLLNCHGSGSWEIWADNKKNLGFIFPRYLRRSQNVPESGPKFILQNYVYWRVYDSLGFVAVLR